MGLEEINTFHIADKENRASSERVIYLDEADMIWKVTEPGFVGKRILSPVFFCFIS